MLMYSRRCEHNKDMFMHVVLVGNIAVRFHRNSKTNAQEDQEEDQEEMSSLTFGKMFEISLYHE